MLIIYKVLSAVEGRIVSANGFKFVGIYGNELLGLLYIACVFVVKGAGKHVGNEADNSQNASQQRPCGHESYGQRAYDECEKCNLCNDKESAESFQSCCNGSCFCLLFKVVRLIVHYLFVVDLGRVYSSLQPREPFA